MILEIMEGGVSTCTNSTIFMILKVLPLLGMQVHNGGYNNESTNEGEVQDTYHSPDRRQVRLLEDKKVCHS
jgi:hypothetical protein